jgi:hypothetical protein
VPFQNRLNRGKVRAAHSDRVSGQGLVALSLASERPCDRPAVSCIPAGLPGGVLFCAPPPCHHENSPGGEVLSPSEPVVHGELPVVCCENPAQPEIPSIMLMQSAALPTSGGRLMAYPPASSLSVLLILILWEPDRSGPAPDEESIGSQTGGSREIRERAVSRVRHNSFVHNDLANCRNRHNMNNRDIQARRNTLSRISNAVPQ